MEKKFIDKDGLKVLWKQIDLKDYPNNETLMAVIDSIDKIKADKEILGNYYLKSEADTLHTEIENYVDTQVAALVNAAPETLDTLGELAAAFEENKEVVEVLDSAISTKANQSDLTTLQNTVSSHTTEINLLKTETWTFTLSNGSTVTKQVVIK